MITELFLSFQFRRTSFPNKGVCRPAMLTGEGVNPLFLLQFFPHPKSTLSNRQSQIVKAVSGLTVPVYR